MHSIFPAVCILQTAYIIYLRFFRRPTKIAHGVYAYRGLKTRKDK